MDKEIKISQKEILNNFPEYTNSGIKKSLFIYLIVHDILKKCEITSFSGGFSKKNIKDKPVIIRFIKPHLKFNKRKNINAKPEKEPIFIIDYFGNLCINFKNYHKNFVSEFCSILSSYSSRPIKKWYCLVNFQSRNNYNYRTAPYLYFGKMNKGIFISSTKWVKGVSYPIFPDGGEGIVMRDYNLFFEVESKSCSVASNLSQKKKKEILSLLSLFTYKNIFEWHWFFDPNEEKKETGLIDEDEFLFYEFAVTKEKNVSDYSKRSIPKTNHNSFGLFENNKEYEKRNDVNLIDTNLKKILNEIDSLPFNHNIYQYINFIERIFTIPISSRNIFESITSMYNFSQSLYGFVKKDQTLEIKKIKKPISPNHTSWKEVYAVISNFGDKKTIKGWINFTEKMQLKYFPKNIFIYGRKSGEESNIYKYIRDKFTHHYKKSYWCFEPNEVREAENLFHRVIVSSIKNIVTQVINL